MKYRVKMVRYADEREEFFVQYKGFFGWGDVTVIEGYDNFVALSYDTFEEAKDYILKQCEAAFKRKVIATEIVFETEV